MTLKERKYSLVSYGENNMGTALTILGLISSLDQASNGDQFGGAMNFLGSLYGSGWFNNASAPSNVHADAGVRRNYL